MVGVWCHDLFGVCALARVRGFGAVRRATPMVWCVYCHRLRLWTSRILYCHRSYFSWGGRLWWSLGGSGPRECVCVPVCVCLCASVCVLLACVLLKDLHN